MVSEKVKQRILSSVREILTEKHSLTARELAFTLYEKGGHKTISPTRVGNILSVEAGFVLDENTRKWSMIGGE